VFVPRQSCVTITVQLAHQPHAPMRMRTPPWRSPHSSSAASPRVIPKIEVLIQPRRDLSYFFCSSASAASTSSLCAGGFTFMNTCATLPFGSMMKVLRADSLFPLYSITEP
jgi:hypothetical protein